MFDCSKVIVQKIGDCNQAIFDSASDMAWIVAADHLPISDSKRFSHAIAERVKNICLTPQDLIGNHAIPNLPPKIIVYDDTSISKVISKFGDLIYDNNLHLCNKKIYKAIGWVGQPNIRRTLPSYFESYGKLGGNRREDFDSLHDYLKVARDHQRDESIAIIRRNILKVILKSLRLLGIKKSNNTPYTEASFIDFIKIEYKELYEELNQMLLQWCKQVYVNKDISVEIKDFITNHVCVHLGVKTNNELHTFMNTPAAIDLELEQKANTYLHERDGRKITINVSNVHSVKGETHTATLYLETFIENMIFKALLIT
ncbi:hypothetical protein [Brevibacillus laterosporus]|uniref:hypothetical protein n=1 Tax=Brevibacillus laterosporus TaxID=1465 RepID=UPI00195B1E98|nr:hypothetical protein [Brevibacillus laterosporus]